MGLNDADLVNEEKKAAEPSDTFHGGDPNPSQLAEIDQLDAGWRDSTGGGVTRGRFQLSNIKKKAAGGIIGAVVAGGFGIFSIVQGPLQIIHFAQLLTQFHFSNNEDFGDQRTSRFIRYMRGTGVERSKLGFGANKLADKYEARMQRESGLRSVYDRTTGRLVGYEIIDREKSVRFLSDADFKDGTDFDIKQNAKESIGNNGRTYGPDGKTSVPLGDNPLISLKADSYGKRRGLVRVITKGTNTSKFAGSLSSRLLIKRGGVDMHPLKNVPKRGQDKLVEYRRTRRQEAAERDRKGVTKPADNQKRGTDSDGDDDDDRTDDEKLIDESREDSGSDTPDADDGKASNRKKLAAGGAVAIGLLCTAKSIGENAEALQHTNVVLPLMRFGARMVASGGQVMANNDTNIDELGALTDQLYDEKTKSSAFAARDIQYENGQEPTGPDIPAVAKPGKVADNPFVKVITTIFEKAGAVGDAACSGIGQFVIGTVAGGLPGAIIGVVQGAAIAATGAPTPSEILADQITQKIAGKEVNTDEVQGAPAGSMANYGTRLAANDAMIGKAGRELSDAEVAQLDSLSKENLRFEQSQQPLYARVFDVYNANSVVGKAIDSAPKEPAQAVASLMRAPATILSAIIPRASAQTYSYDYGFSEYGFSEAEQQDTRFDDPFANAAIVEPLLEERDGDAEKGLNDEYGDCFNTTIDEEGKIVTGESKRYDEIDDKCKGSDEMLLRYRFYVADTITNHTLLCAEGEEDSCNQLGFGDQTPGEAASGDTGEAEDLPTDGFKNTNTADIQCPVGSSDMGTKDVPTGEGLPKSVKQFKIRLCKVPGVPTGVNSAVAGNVMKMISDAGNAGVVLSGGSFRTTASQISLRQKNKCADIYTASANTCKPPTARPGQSMHEQALAIDFVNCGTRSTKCYIWLSKNAANYGFKNLPSEAWHWSTNGN